MKRTIFTLLVCAFALSLSAQLNMTLKANITYPGLGGNDVWGYAAPDGSEYALMGTTGGLSIVDVSDPENSYETQFIPGANSTWRDIKTWSHYAYVSNETGGGILIVDLSNLPGTCTFYDWAPTINGGTLSSVHNLFIDEFGKLYFPGSNILGGATLVADLNNDPWNPVYIGPVGSNYSHDVYARDNKVYNSEIYAGRLAIYDVADMDNVQLLGSKNTPANFTHNAWLSDDSQVCFTTDEVGDAPVASYDISDPTNIVELDQFRPLESINQGVLPHNVHVWNDWLIISYYSVGCIIADGSRPDNIIEVGNFDTFLGGGTGSGLWGAYPFLPSGIVLASDMQNGLFVLEADYVRACWLEGNVTDAGDNSSLGGVDIVISNSFVQETTDGFGDYASGVATAGTYDVTFSKAGYTSQTISVDLDNGMVEVLDVALVPIAQIAVSGKVQLADGTPVPGAFVNIVNSDFDFDLLTDANGDFNLNMWSGTFNVYGGKWGYKVGSLDNQLIDGSSSVVITVEEGYYDEFVMDLGWNVQGDAGTGMWERGDPVGTDFQGQPSNPEDDASNMDIGNMCYVTGNGGGGAGNDDVDDGSTILTSPAIDISGWNEPTVKMALWFFNAGGNGNPDDQVTVSVTDGQTTETMLTIPASTGGWTNQEFLLSDYIDPTTEARIIIETGDLGDGHLVEAAVDLFEAFDANPIVSTEDISSTIQMETAPNPFSESAVLTYDMETWTADTRLEVYNVTGQLQATFEIDQATGAITLGADWANGVYYAKMLQGNKVSQSVKIVKTK